MKLLGLLLMAPLIIIICIGACIILDQIYEKQPMLFWTIMSLGPLAFGMFLYIKKDING